MRKKLTSLVEYYAAHDIQPLSEQLKNELTDIINDNDLAYIRSKGGVVLQSSPASIDDLIKILQKRIENARAEKAEIEKKYITACRLQEAAQSAEDFGNAAALFKEIIVYKDSNARQIDCFRNQQELQEKAYVSATAALEKAKSKKALDDAAKQFSAISDYKDSNKQLIEIEKKKKSIKTKNISILLCFVIALVGIGLFLGYRFVIIPNHYKNAEIALSNGDYVTAIHEFASAKGYLDSDALLQQIVDEHPDAYRASLDVGQSFTFGTYNGEPIEWVILEKEGTRTLVISRNILCRRQFDPSERKAPWRVSSLRSWLNGSFYEGAFNAEEAKRILSTTVNTPDSNINYVVDGGGNTTDKVFILSIAEANQYMSHIPSVDGVWWLRNPGAHNGESAVVRGGQVNTYGISNQCGDGHVTATREDWENNTVYGPRPVMWLDLSYSND